MESKSEEYEQIFKSLSSLTLHHVQAKLDGIIQNIIDESLEESLLVLMQSKNKDAVLSLLPPSPRHSPPEMGPDFIVEDNLEAKIIEELKEVQQAKEKEKEPEFVPESIVEEEPKPEEEPIDPPSLVVAEPSDSGKSEIQEMQEMSVEEKIEFLQQLIQHGAIPLTRSKSDEEAIENALEKIEKQPRRGPLDRIIDLETLINEKVNRLTHAGFYNAPGINQIISHRNRMAVGVINSDQNPIPVVIVDDMKKTKSAKTRREERKQSTTSLHQ